MSNNNTQHQQKKKVGCTWARACVFEVVFWQSICLNCAVSYMVLWKWSSSRTATSCRHNENLLTRTVLSHNACDFKFHVTQGQGTGKLQKNKKSWATYGIIFADLRLPHYVFARLTASILASCHPPLSEAVRPETEKLGSCLVVLAKKINDIPICAVAVPPAKRNLNSVKRFRLFLEKIVRGASRLCIPHYQKLYSRGTRYEQSTQMPTNECAM